MEKHLLPDAELRGLHVVRQSAEYAPGVVTLEQAFLAIRSLPRQYANHVPSAALLISHVSPSTFFRVALEVEESLMGTQSNSRCRLKILQEGLHARG